MKSSLIFILTILMLFSCYSQSADKLKIGDQAPDIVLRYATKDSIASDALKLSNITGKSNIILAFYPADWSGGCTKEVCTLRDNFSKLSELNAEVLAISGDYVFSHHEWAKFLHLPFKLLSDHNHSVAKMYNSYNEANGYNQRTVYLIDKNRMITYIDLNYSVSDSNSFEHLKAALERLK